MSQEWFCDTCGEQYETDQEQCRVCGSEDVCQKSTRIRHGMVLSDEVKGLIGQQQGHHLIYAQEEYKANLLSENKALKLGSIGLRRRIVELEEENAALQKLIEDRETCPVCNERDTDGLEACSKCYGDHFKSTMELAKLRRRIERAKRYLDEHMPEGYLALSGLLNGQVGMMNGVALYDDR